MRLYILFVLSGFIGCVLLAGQANGSICHKKETVVFFGNGIKSIKKEAFKAKEAIKNNLESELSPEDFAALKFDVSYNRTHTLPLDLLESTIQLLTSNTSRFWRLIFGLEIMPDWFAEKIILLATLLDKSALVTTDSLWEHVNTYQTAIAEGKKVLLVAHSQGSLFGNQAYSHLSPGEKQSFGMVSVANVDSNVLGDATDAAPYTTLENDKLILTLIAVQAALPTSPMSPNTENTNAAEDFWGHSFLHSYMAEGSESNQQITGDIINVLAGLESPSQIVEPGVITVSLTWGPAPDVDLHVYSFTCAPRGACSQLLRTVATAWAAIPSPRPVNPMPSVVLPFSAMSKFPT